MIVRRIALLAGVVALLVGVVGLIVPVSVSPEPEKVTCGSAAFPDLAAARARDDGSGANIPILGELVVDTNYTRLCQMELSDRRAWTVSLAVVGALAVAGAIVLGALSKRGG